MRIRDMKERFLREAPESRLGHLASNLLRISDLEPTTENWPVVERSARESMYFIEWATAEAPEEYRSAMAGLQSQLSDIYNSDPGSWQRPEAERLRTKLKDWADHLVVVLLDIQNNQPLPELPASLLTQQ